MMRYPVKLRASDTPLTRWMTALSCLALSVAATGCVIVADGHGQVRGTGSLTTSWSLDGSVDPDVCWYHAVDTVEVAVYDLDDRRVISARPYCEDFGVTFDGLRDDAYTLEVTLLDAGGHAVSDTLVVDTDVWAGEETFVDVNFPDAIIY